MTAVPLMTMPNFLVVGAMKAGTTSLYRCLRQHPDIFMPFVKEPHFFTGKPSSEWRGPDAGRRGTQDLAEYRSLFAEGQEKRARGEATPFYLCDPTAVDSIRRHIPDAKIIAVLRQPVDRAYSAYLMKCRQGWERLGFEEALAEEPRRIEQGWGYGWHYANLGRYREQIERYHRCFSPAQIKVVLFDDLVRDSRRLMRELFRFLEVGDSFEPDSSRPYNAAFSVKHPAIHRWFTSRSTIREHAKRLMPSMARPLWERVSSASQRWNSTVPIPLAPALRATLTRQWHGEIQALEEFIGQDLSSWREI